MKIAVVTPTIGSEHLKKCLESVANQTYKNLTHYVFIDGEQYWDAVSAMVPKEYSHVKYVHLQENVGKGWYGHRVYSACSFLVNADVIIYLDEDNWIDPDHVEKMIQALDGNDWVYSLRKIYDKDGKYLCHDDCESLGVWPVFFDERVHHIDTSCYAVRKDVAVRIGHAWYGQWGADRQFFYNLSKNYPKFACTLEHTLCYRLDGNPNSVKKEFFDQGNLITLQKYSGKLPWKTK